MQYMVSVNTNKGTKKDVNQDAALILEAEAGSRHILLASICDGMGGLTRGEVASGCMIRRTREWFQTKFPPVLFSGPVLDGNALKQSLNALVSDVNEELSRLAEKTGEGLCGTTCVLLITDGTRYVVMNVGDSRAYRIRGNIVRLTKDQTVVRQEIDAGRLTEEEAERDPRRNILLQCIGASRNVVPDYTDGSIRQGDLYMLCSDGFRHKLSEDELRDLLDPERLVSEEEMSAAGEQCIRMNMDRRERDNITVVMIRPVAEETE